MRTLPLVVSLGATQTIAWASSTYLPAILAKPIARDLGVSTGAVFAAFSLSLVVMALAGPAVGRAIDRSGGRGMLAASNLVLAAGLVALGAAQGATTLFAAWIVLGAGMAMGLYDAAFATLVRLLGSASRGAITGITLIAGFASTVGWPLTAFLDQHYGWRECCYAWAALNVLVCLPMNLWFIPRAAKKEIPVKAPGEGIKGGAPAPLGREFVLLAIFFAMAAFVTSAMAAHLPRLLLAAGATTAAAITAGALLGPAQVAARLTEFFAARRWRFHPLFTARLATALHPAAGAVLAVFGGAPLAAAAYALLHGAGNGMVTIARGTLPLAIFGAEGYGHRLGLLNVLGRVMQALAPFAYDLVLDHYGARAGIGLTAGLSLAALAALLAIQRRAPI